MDFCKRSNEYSISSCIDWSFAILDEQLMKNSEFNGRDAGIEILRNFKINKLFRIRKKLPKQVRRLLAS